MTTENPFDLTGVTTILCDADGTLFPSEEPAYEASASVTAAFAERFGIEGDFSPEHLRHTGTGRNFRSLTRDLLTEAGVEAPADELDEWIVRERLEVTAHLAATLRPDADVVAVTEGLLRNFRLAVVSSSASARLLSCLNVTGLSDTFLPEDVFSAEDSMPTPIGKPDPAIYLHAMKTLGVTPGESIAIEDSSTGVKSAVAAGLRTIGIVAFVAPDEQEQRIRELAEAGAELVVQTWAELGGVLLTSTPTPTP
jgi:beta-phosphoglucomutase-like phosphatase (HAD superfamily)